ncbi:MAG: pyridoxamine kinase [Firmicutes bacterium]|nr:pyridoxamine kinase [Bacillota bacterium]
MTPQKRVLAIHDISCVGKCSITVALPIISAAGAECSILPTSVLSTHTGGFDGYTFCDLTDEIEPITEHWKTLGLHVDAIYTGYLGSFRQIDLMKKIFDDFHTENGLICVDPVMGDNGKLYALFTEEFAKGMASLCGKADLIMPNLTEASYMTGVEYKDSDYDEAYIRTVLDALHGLGAKKVVLTGVSFEEGKLGAAASENGKVTYIMNDRIEGYYHGTGDVFGSSLVAALTMGKSLTEAVTIAVNYTVACIRRTKEAGTEARYGVNFEQEIPLFLELLK